MNFYRYAAVLSVTMLFVAAVARAQAFPDRDRIPDPLTLKKAVEYALAHHPSIASAAGFERAASAQLEQARSQYIPSGYLGLQENRATGNVVPGAHFNMEGLPPISGPPRGRVFDSGVWGSTGGFSLSYDVAHLTQTMALVDASLADLRGMQSAADAQALAVAFGAADAFAAAVEADQQQRAARVALERSEVFQNTVGAMVQSGLRPGADAARAAAETAAAERNLIKIEAEQGLSATRLAEALGAAGQEIHVAPGRLATRLPSEEPAEVSFSLRNPSLVAAQQSSHAARERERAAALEYIPRVEIAAALFGRANGLFPGGANLHFGQGLVPDTPNWAAGVVITIPILEYPEIRARDDMTRAQEKIASAHQSEVIQQVRTQVDSARVILKSASRAAKEARIELDASHAAVDEAKARYKAGLYGIDPVAEALRLLAQAEADDAEARIDVWRATLLLARSVGDMQPLLKDVNQASVEDR